MPNFGVLGNLCNPGLLVHHRPVPRPATPNEIQSMVPDKDDAPQKVTSLAALIADVEIDLEKVPLEFSFMEFLSPGCKDLHLKITIDGETLTSEFLATLAFNQACRVLRRGAFYCMPQHARRKAHACDMVYTNDFWGTRGCAKWDASTWTERLKMVTANEQLLHAEKVIPVCLRILRNNEMGWSTSPASSDSRNDLHTRPREEKCRDHVHLPSRMSFTYATKHDPAIQPNKSRYSRRLEDISTYLIMFDSPFSKPFVCLTGAAEHEIICTRNLTPNHLSETFCRRTKADRCQILTNAGGRAQQLVAQGAVDSHKEVVQILSEAFEEDQRLGLKDPDQKLFGRVTYLWQEVVNRVEGSRWDDSTFDMRGHMNNFANLLNIALDTNIEDIWKIPRPTIEIRQHKCTIDATEAELWVRFNEAVVQKAVAPAEMTSPATDARTQRSKLRSLHKAFVMTSGCLLSTNTQYGQIEYDERQTNE